MSILKAGQRFLAPYQLSDIHTAADIQEFGAIGKRWGFELTRLRLVIKSYAIVKKEISENNHNWVYFEATICGCFVVVPLFSVLFAFRRGGDLGVSIELNTTQSNFKRRKRAAKIKRRKMFDRRAFILFQ